MTSQRGQIFPRRQGEGFPSLTHEIPSSEQALGHVHQDKRNEDSSHPHPHQFPTPIKNDIISQRLTRPSLEKWMPPECCHPDSSSHLPRFLGGDICILTLPCPRSSASLRERLWRVSIMKWNCEWGLALRFLRPRQFSPIISSLKQTCGPCRQRHGQLLSLGRQKNQLWKPWIIDHLWGASVIFSGLSVSVEMSRNIGPLQLS